MACCQGSKPKTKRTETPRHLIETGVNEIILWGRSIRSVALEIGTDNSTLGRDVKQAQVMGSRELSIDYKHNRQVFSADQEIILQGYLVRAANIYFRLSPKNVREPEYECAIEFGLETPDQWSRDKCAGPDWFSGFLKRNPSVSIRTPKATSLSRATSFNRSNVDRFFGQLKTVLDRDRKCPMTFGTVMRQGWPVCKSLHSPLAYWFRYTQVCQRQRHYYAFIPAALEPQTTAPG